MPDMFDLLEEGIEEGAPGLEATLNSALALPAIGGAEIYANGGESASEGNLVIPVYIGQEHLDTIILRSEQVSTYRRGG